MIYLYLFCMTENMFCCDKIQYHSEHSLGKYVPNIEKLDTYVRNKET